MQPKGTKEDKTNAPTGRAFKTGDKTETQSAAQKAALQIVRSCAHNADSIRGLESTEPLSM